PLYSSYEIYAAKVRKNKATTYADNFLLLSHTVYREEYVILNRILYTLNTSTYAMARWSPWRQNRGQTWYVYRGQSGSRRDWWRQHPIDSYVYGGSSHTIIITNTTRGHDTGGIPVHYRRRQAVGFYRCSAGKHRRCLD